jgi:hypothetical protein
MWAMAKSKEDRIDSFTTVVGFALGYGAFAGFLVFYQKIAIGYFDSDDFAIRLMTPFSLRLRWTDFVCYGLIALAIFGIAKLRDQL